MSLFCCKVSCLINSCNISFACIKSKLAIRLRLLPRPVKTHYSASNFTIICGWQMRHASQTSAMNHPRETRPGPPSRGSIHCPKCSAPLVGSVANEPNRWLSRSDVPHAVNVPHCQPSRVHRMHLTVVLRLCLNGCNGILKLVFN